MGMADNSKQLPAEFSAVTYTKEIKGKTVERTVETRYTGTSGANNQPWLWYQVRDDSGLHGLSLVSPRDSKNGVAHRLSLQEGDISYRVEFMPTRNGYVEITGGSATDSDFGNSLTPQDATEVLARNAGLVEMVITLAKEHVPRRHKRAYNALSEYVSHLPK